MSISLNKSVRTCKVNTGWAPRIQSDRFENSNLMMCPVWNKRDLAGREVCADSFWTKREGCNSSLDRIDVENWLRPQYMEYVTLDAAGIDGQMYANQENVGVTESFQRPHNLRENFKSPCAGGACRVGGGAQQPAANPAYRGPIGKSAIRENFVKQMFYDDATYGSNFLDNRHKYTGQFGQNNFRAWVDPTCPQYSYEQAMAEVAQEQRNLQGANLGAHYQNMRTSY